MDERLKRLSEGLSLSDKSRVTIRNAIAAQSIVREEHSMMQKIRHFRGPLIAAALTVLMAAVALAVGSLGGWESFFGKVPENVTTPVGVSTISGDYTIALEETIMDEDGAAFLLSLKRTDGGVLEGEPGLYNMWLDIKDELANMGFRYQDPIRSADGTTIYHCFQFKHDNEDVETLSGHKIVLRYQGIIDNDWTEAEFQRVNLEAVSLAPMVPVIQQADVSFGIYADVEDPDFVAAMDLLDATAVPGTLPMTKRKLEFSLAGGVLSQDGKTLALALYEPEGTDRDGEYLTLGAEAITLSDARTGERIGTIYGGWRSKLGYSITLFELDRPMTLEDLPNLEATVKYNTVKFLSDEPFELTFAVTDSGYKAEYSLDRQAEVAFHGFKRRYTLHMTALRISALELRLLFDTVESVEKEPSEETVCKLIYDDGEEISLIGGVSLNRVNSPERDRYLTFRPTENVLLDPLRAAALQLGNTHIDLQ